MNLKFEDELKGLINKYSIENGSDTPDFLLRDYIIACLSAFNCVVNKRELWYGRGIKPVKNIDRG